MNNNVSLLVDGEYYDYWESAQISNELNTISPAFNVQITAKIPDAKTAIKKFRVGQHVQLIIGYDVIITGYIDQTPVSYDSGSVTAAIAGRSKTSDLIECTVMLPDVKWTTDEGRWAGTKDCNDGGTVVDAPSVPAVHWTNTPLETIIAQLIKPYNIKLIREVPALTKPISFGAEPTETVLSTIRKLVKHEDLILYGNEYGNLVIAKKGNSTAFDILSLGNNVLNGNASFDGTKTFSYYRTLGQTAGSDTKTGSKVSTYHADATDDNVTRTRLLTVKSKGQSDNTACSNQSEHDSKYNHAQFYKVTYTVQGWRQSNGDLWKINQLVDVVDYFLDINTFETGQLLITKVTYNLTNDGGMTTTIDVVPPDGYVETKDTSSDTTTSKSKKKTSKKKSSKGTDFGWLNK